MSSIQFNIRDYNFYMLDGNTIECSNYRTSLQKHMSLYVFESIIDRVLENHKKLKYLDSTVMFLKNKNKYEVYYYDNTQYSRLFKDITYEELKKIKKVLREVKNLNSISE